MKKYKYEREDFRMSSQHKEALKRLVEAEDGMNKSKWVKRQIERCAKRKGLWK